ncbi:MAG: bifunctional nuclease family protein [Gemmatimonadaceae bacterium]|nr:bifunctional nuclease family protein [Gemmatimonadaceae bacterium]
MIEVTVSRLGLDSSTNSYVVVLQERGGTRLLPIWIGQPEAESIVMHMHDVKRARPLTHDLVRSLIVGMGAQLTRVQITRVEKSTYYAELHLQHGADVVQIDARPSDSIAVALRLAAPIYAAESLLVDPGVDADDEEDEESTTFGPEPDLGLGDARQPDDTELSAEQLKSYLENLRPEDFGKFNP